VSEAVLVAVITAVGVVLAAFMGVIIALLNRTRQHARAASNHASEAVAQTKNHHEENMRDNIDRNHQQVLGAIGQIHLVLASLDGRVEAVEDTIPGHHHFKPPPRGKHT
jgi:hypothetical protein